MSSSLRYDEMTQNFRVQCYNTAYVMVTGSEGTPFRHMHNNYEAALFENNALHVVNGGMAVHIQAPCILMHRPYTLHGVYTLPNVRCRRWIINFDASFFAGIDKNYLNVERIYKNDLQAIPLNDGQFERMRQLYTAVNDEANIHLRPFLAAMILKEIEEISANDLANEAVQAPLYIAEVIRHISLNYMNPLSTPQIARHFGVSVTKLNRDFRFYTNSTVHDFINRIRMEAAARMLTAEQSISIVAYRCGFTNDSHFIRAFRAFYNITPLQYAKKLREKNAQWSL